MLKSNEELCFAGCQSDKSSPSRDTAGRIRAGCEASIVVDRLVVVQEDASLAVGFLEHLVLGPEVLDHLLLLLVDPTRHGHDPQLPRFQDKLHSTPKAIWNAQV